MDENLLTAGQPTTRQLAELASAGFELVVNLAPADASNALQDEAGTVTALGMQYLHIPVDWEAPAHSDLEKFILAMRTYSSRRMLVHCAANYRVSAFYSLYAMLDLGWTSEQARAFRAPIWDGSHYPVWQSFLSETEQRFAAAG